jgi:hypothetical protein
MIEKNDGQHLSSCQAIIFSDAVKMQKNHSCSNLVVEKVKLTGQNMWPML